MRFQGRGQLDGLGEHSTLLFKRRERVRRTWTKGLKNAAHNLYLTIKLRPESLLTTFFPIGVVVGVLNLNPVAVFIVNLLALMSLTALLDLILETIEDQTRAWLNALVGNGIELVTSLVAVFDDCAIVAQNILIGSALNNMLLGLSSGLICSSIGHREARINRSLVNTMSGLLGFAAAAVTVPFALHFSLLESIEYSIGEELFVSRAIAVVMLMLHLSYLAFRLKTHRHLFDDTSDTARSEVGTTSQPQQLSTLPTLGFLAVLLLLAALTSHFAINSLASFANSKAFTALVIIPVALNATKQTRAGIATSREDLNAAIDLTVGSAVQTILLLVPLMVIVGWITDTATPLYFGPFETVYVFLSVLVVGYILQSRQANYFQGLVCLAMYGMIVISFWVLPDSRTANLAVFVSKQRHR